MKDDDVRDDDRALYSPFIRHAVHISKKMKNDDAMMMSNTFPI